MTVYVLVALGAAVFSVLYAKETRRQFRVLWCALLFLSLFVPAALRCGIGVDYANYAALWNDMASGIPVSQEPLFRLSMRVLQALHLPFHSLIVLYALLTYACVLYACPRQYAPAGALSYVFLCYLDSYNLIRQSLAGAVMLVALRFFFERKYIRTVLFCVLAALNHKTAMLGALLMPLSLVVPRCRRAVTLTVFAVVAVLVFFLRHQIVVFVMQTVLPHTPYSGYRGTAYETAAPLGTVTTGLGILLRVMCFCVLLWLCTGESVSKTEHGYAVVFLFTLMIFYELASVLYIIGRLRNSLLYALVWVWIIAAKSADAAKPVTVRNLRPVCAHRLLMLLVMLSYAALFFRGIPGLRIHEDIWLSGKQIYPYTTLWSWRDNAILRDRLEGSIE